jgi:hypothetical protein
MERNTGEEVDSRGFAHCHRSFASRFLSFALRGPHRQTASAVEAAARGGRPVRPEVTRGGGWRDREMELAARKEDGDAGGCAAGARGGTEEETHRRAGGWPACSMRDASLAG